MIEIPLTKGFVAFIDDEDLPLVSAHSWSVKDTPKPGAQVRYAQCSVGGKIVLMHRLIMAARPGQPIDHVDGDGLNNRRGNLRIAVGAGNQRNVSKRRRNRSGFKGVMPRRGRWIAQISVGGRAQWIGSFADLEEAARAYDDAAREIFGEFARTNFLEETPCSRQAMDSQ